MRKILFAGLILSLCMIAGSCGQQSNATGENDSDTLILDSLIVEELEYTTTHVDFADSLDENGTMLHYQVGLDVPQTGASALITSVIEWMNQILGGTYTGKKTFDDEMLRYYAATYFDEHTSDIELQSDFGCSLELNVELRENNDKYITYEVEGYDYTGGAHGMPIQYGVTFIKSDGRQLGWDMFADTTGLAAVFLQHVANYFETDNTEDINELLFDNVVNNFPLPCQEPWLVPEGIKFCYTAYEIAPYAAGCPEGVIPCNKAKKYLTPDVLVILQTK